MARDLVRKVIPTGKCIYCGKEQQLSPEHYLPECLGTFTNFETLDDRICHDCNGRCGRELEEQFCRGGDIAYFRHLLGIKGKKTHRDKVDFFLRGSGGGSALKMKGNIPGQNEEVHYKLVKNEGKGTVGVDYLSQLILRSETGDPHYILLENIKTAEELQEKIEALKIEKLTEINVIATPEMKERIEQLTAFLPILQKFEWEELPKEGTIYTTTSFEVTDKYFRAIAKIGFHYMLKHLRSFRGDEEIFAGIRQFILEGGKIDEFVRWTNKQFLMHVEEGYRPENFGHAIHARANQKLIWCKLQFFIGPGSKPDVYDVVLARNNSSLIYDIASGHSFCYYSDGPKDGRLGVMDELAWIHKPPTKLRSQNLLLSLFEN